MLCRNPLRIWFAFLAMSNSDGVPFSLLALPCFGWWLWLRRLLLVWRHALVGEVRKQRLFNPVPAPTILHFYTDLRFQGGGDGYYNPTLLHSCCCHFQGSLTSHIDNVSCYIHFHTRTLPSYGQAMLFMEVVSCTVESRSWSSPQLQSLQSRFL